MRTDSAKTNQIRTSNDLQNTTQNTKERERRALLKFEGELICPGKIEGELMPRKGKKFLLDQ
jgi:hypothetical protein